MAVCWTHSSMPMSVPWLVSTAHQKSSYHGWAEEKKCLPWPRLEPLLTQLAFTIAIHTADSCSTCPLRSQVLFFFSSTVSILHCCMGSFHPWDRTFYLSLLKFIRFLPMLCSSLLKSFWRAALPSNISATASKQMSSTEELRRHSILTLILTLRLLIALSSTEPSCNS